MASKIVLWALEIALAAFVANYAASYDANLWNGIAAAMH